MRYKRFYFFLLVLFSHQAYCQIDSILSLPGDDLQVKGFFDWATQSIFWDGEMDRDKKLALINEATEKFSKTNNQRLIRECWFFNQLFNSRGEINEPANVDKSVRIILEAAKEANEKDWFFTEAQCRMSAAAIYFNKKRYRECFEQAYRSYDIFQKEGLDKYPEAGYYIAQIADWYHFFGDYDAAIRYLKEALTVREPWSHMDRGYTTINTLAMCYLVREKYDSTIYYYQKAHEEAVRANSKFWQGLIEGNMAQIYILTGQIDKALPLSVNDFNNSKANNQLGSAANAANDLATIYLKKGDLTTAEKYITYALQNFDTTYPSSKIRIYQKLSQLNAMKGNYGQAYLFLDSFV
ncbi:MAG: tetratricopeptide repeat protein, partial [Bacteroidota bacterium]